MTERTTEARPRAVGRAGNIGLWVLQVLLALFLGMAGAGKLAGEEAAIQLFDDIGFGQWLRYLTGALELAGAIGLLIPALTGLAALGLAAVMFCAALTDAFILGGNPVVPGVLMVLALIVAWGRRDRLSALRDRVSRGT